MTETRVDALRKEMEALRAKCARYEERLEIDHHFVMGDGEELVRVEVPEGERETHIDGIECRDATIHFLEKQLQKQHVALTSSEERVRELEGGLRHLASLPLGAEIIEEIDLVLYANAGRSITVGDVLEARRLLAARAGE